MLLLELDDPRVPNSNDGSVGAHGAGVTSHGRSGGDFGGVIDLVLFDCCRLLLLDPELEGTEYRGLGGLEDAALGGSSDVTGGVCPTDRGVRSLDVCGSLELYPRGDGSAPVGSARWGA